MTNKTPAPRQKRLRLAGLLCTLLGTLTLLAVLAVYLPLTVPRALGYQIYTIVSGSMEPGIPVGSAVYVQTAAAQELEPGTVIAFFNAAGETVVHRVQENHTVEGELITKGDANTGEDLSAVGYSAVIGRVAFSLPLLGRLAGVMATAAGKLYALGFVAAAAMFYLLGGRFAELAGAAEKT